MEAAMSRQVSNSEAFAWRTELLSGLPGWRALGLTRSRVSIFTEIVTDTRQIGAPGFLFVALSGEKHDGHRFIPEAIAKGAAGIVVRADSGISGPAGLVTYRVNDTGKALWDLARLKRQAYDGAVATLTGSAGKTSAKHFIAQLAGPAVYVNPGNFNNQIGVPLAIFAAPMRTSAWVLELGMNAAGEIGSLTGLVQPDYGLLLPAGTAHVGAFSGVEQIVAAKAEMLERHVAPGVVLVHGNQYDHYLPDAGRVVRLGTPQAGYQCRAGAVAFPAGTRYVISEQDWSRHILLGLHGQHWGASVGAAWALLREMGLLNRRHVGRLQKLQAPNGRMALLAHQGNWILNDSYNASPESFHAWLDYLEALDRRLTLRLVVGDMLELGRHGRSIHRAVASRIAGLKPSKLVVVGRGLAKALDGLGVRYVACRTPGDAVTEGLKNRRPGTLTAFKAANGIGLYDALKESGV